MYNKGGSPENSKWRLTLPLYVIHHFVLQINQYDILASQINQEFDDLDEFQLSID